MKLMIYYQERLMDKEFRSKLVQILQEQDQPFSDQDIFLQEISIVDLLNQPNFVQSQQDDQFEGIFDLEEERQIVQQVQKITNLKEELPHIQSPQKSIIAPILLCNDQTINQFIDLRSSYSIKFGVPLCICQKFRIQAIGTTNSLVIVLKIGARLPFSLSTNKQYRGCKSLDISEGGTSIVAGFQKGVIVIWDVDSRSQLKSIVGVHNSPILSISLWKGSFQSIVSSQSSGPVCLIQVRKQLWSYSVNKQVLIDGKDPVFQIQCVKINNAAVYIFVSINSIVILQINPARIITQIKRPNNLGQYKIPGVGCNEKYLACSWGRSIQIYDMKSEYAQIIKQTSLHHKVIRIVFLKQDHFLIMDSCQTFKLFKIDSVLNQIWSLNYPSQTLKSHTVIKESQSIFNFFSNTVVLGQDSVLAVGKTIIRVRLLRWNQQIQHCIKDGDWVQAFGLTAKILNGKYTTYSRKVTKLQSVLQDMIKSYLRQSLSPARQRAQLVLNFCLQAGQIKMVQNSLQRIFMQANCKEELMQEMKQFVRRGRLGATQVPRIQDYLQQPQLVRALVKSVLQIKFLEEDKLLQACCNLKLYDSLSLLSIKTGSFLTPINKIVSADPATSINIFNYLQGLINGVSKQAFINVQAFVQALSWILDQSSLNKLKCISIRNTYQLLKDIVSANNIQKFRQAHIQIQKMLGLQAYSHQRLIGQIVKFFKATQPYYARFFCFNYPLCLNPHDVRQQAQIIANSQIQDKQEALISLMNYLDPQLIPDAFLQKCQKAKSAKLWLTKNYQLALLDQNTICQLMREGRLNYKHADSQMLSNALQNHLQRIALIDKRLATELFLGLLQQKSQRILLSLQGKSLINMVLCLRQKSFEIPKTVNQKFLLALCQLNPKRLLFEIKKYQYEIQSKLLQKVRNLGLKEPLSELTSKLQILQETLTLKGELLIDQLETILQRTCNRLNSQFSRLRKLKNEIIKSNEENHRSTLVGPALRQICKKLILKFQQAVKRLGRVIRRTTTKTFISEIQVMTSDLIRQLLQCLDQTSLIQFIDSVGQSLETIEIRQCIGNLLAQLRRQKSMFKLTLKTQCQELNSLMKLKLNASSHCSEMICNSCKGQQFQKIMLTLNCGHLFHKDCFKGVCNTCYQNFDNRSSLLVTKQPELTAVYPPQAQQQNCLRRLRISRGLRQRYEKEQNDFYNSFL